MATPRLNPEEKARRRAERARQRQEAAAAGTPDPGPDLEAEEPDTAEPTEEASSPAPSPPPRPNPLPPPEPPQARRGPGRPRKAAPAPERGVLPADPEEAERALAVYRVQAIPYVETVASLAAVLPPQFPLLPAERSALETSIALVLHKYGGAIDPLIGLALVLAAIGIPRYVAARHVATEKATQRTDPPAGRGPGEATPQASP